MPSPAAAAAHDASHRPFVLLRSPRYVPRSARRPPPVTGIGSHLHVLRCHLQWAQGQRGVSGRQALVGPKPFLPSRNSFLRVIPSLTPKLSPSVRKFSIAAKFTSHEVGRLKACDSAARRTFAVLCRRRRLGPKRDHRSEAAA